jgi:cytochrome c oxidase subunit 2
VRRRLLVLALLLVGALALEGAAAASNGGLAPVQPNSPNAQRIHDVYVLVLVVAGVVFLVVEGALITFGIRFDRRGRPRTTEGPQIHGSTRLELIWTAVPVLLLAVIVAFAFYKLPGIKNVPAASAGERLNVQVEAHQFYWRFIYPGGEESINTLRVPVGKVVTLDVTSADVAHSWWVPALGGKIDAIPGKVNHTWFKAERVGTYAVRCAEFCGYQHAAMRGFVRVYPDARGGKLLATAPLGKQAVEGVCAACHGFRLEGLVGPPIANSATLNDPKTLRTVITQGIGQMPAVGKGWDAKLLNATIGYLKSKYGTQQGGTTAGG